MEENVKKRSSGKGTSTRIKSGTSPPYERDNLVDDRGNIVLLLFLYLLQGIPLGLSAAIPIILQNRKIDYKEQAEFSLAFWPFSMKLLWAPIVDAVFWYKFGRRKSWLIPTQLLIGIFMILLSMNVDNYLGDEKGLQAPNITLLSLVFFVCNFLAATQDIAVDGWALTMLHRKNVGHASTCNSVGQTAGYFLGYVLFIALDSADFCNRYLFWLRPENSDRGIISFSSFMYFWGIVYILATILVAIFKTEAMDVSYDSRSSDFEGLNIRESYGLLWKIMKLKPVQMTAMILLTVKIGFAATDSVSPLKLVENGVPKDKLALLAVPLIPLQIILPFLISRYVVGPNSMDYFVAVIPYRLLVGLAVAVIVYITPYFEAGEDLPYYYYAMLLCIYCLHQLVAYCMHVALMAFFAKVSDPKAGGTYMTLLNTLSNLGGTWTSTTALALVDGLTWKSCDENCPLNQIKDCNCVTFIDGYYVETLLCCFIGAVWIWFGKRALMRLQNLNEAAWLVKKRQNKND